MTTPDTDPAAPALACTLWSDPERTRHFLIPGDLRLPRGDTVLRRTGGHQCQVDAAAVALFEVDAATADTWAKDELGRVLRQLGGNLRRAFTSAPAAEALKDAPTAAPVTPGLDLLAAITGTPRADLDAGGGAVVEALRRYASDIGGTVAGAVSGDAARIASAQARMAEWAATLRDHGTEVAAPGPAAGPAPAVGAAADEVPLAVPRAPDPTPGATAGNGVVAGLQALAEEFRRRADALAAARAGGLASCAAPGAGSGSADGPAFEAPGKRAETQAAALDALATGIEDVADDAAARLRAHAARLRRRA